eukprot:CAMPEP_0194043984 /NCGR_PEP_ID=MMETSP0009_2-20130614/15535_1 /TAXON_ID=210454 /ORGANISM="Grammatophora oceanica, Strain CCMP 410" /LENGTH=212 /DNA_ID=CAMNT_0038688385 /DNA_START=86 /DNA_END=721 /DNA_ORIENTATION=+
MPVLTNLDEVALEKVYLRPESLNSLLSTVESISLECCEMLQQDAPRAEQFDCLESRASALRRNCRIKHLKLVDHSGLVLRDPEGMDELVEAVTTRSSLEFFAGYVRDRSSEDFEFKWTATHMRKFGRMRSLRHLFVDMMDHGSSLLQALSAPRPRNLIALVVGFGSSLSDSDFRELIDFLSDPKCKIEVLKMATYNEVIQCSFDNLSFPHER